MRKKLLKKKNHQEWSWILIFGFFALGIIDYHFGILGLICMTIPFYHAFKGHGKLHCSHYCPRGSFLGKFLGEFSLNNNTPKFMRTKWFKNIVLFFMIGMLTFAMYHSGGNPKKIGFAIFRFMLASSIVSVILGVLFKPRSWCQICPMGYSTGLVNELKAKKTDKKVA
jgi:hypothetical protein